MTVRVTRDEDWPELRRVRLRALADTPEAFASTLAEERDLPEDRWHGWATPTDSSANFFAIEDAGPRGMVAVFREPENPALAHLVAMWVDPAFRRRGIGGTLIDAVVQWSRDHDAEQVHLWAVESNTSANELYRVHGFVPTGRRQPHPSDPSVTEVELSRIVHGDTD